MRIPALSLTVATVARAALPLGVAAQALTTAGRPAQLEIRPAGSASVRVTLKPVGFETRRVTYDGSPRTVTF